MDEKHVHPTDADNLRLRAEKRIQTKTTEAYPPRTKDETQRLLHELQVHQIELEMQNAELRHARDEMETALDRYTDLYDFAPVSFVTLDRDGVIRGVNLTGADLLGVERSRLIGRHFTHFVTTTMHTVFTAFLAEVFSNPVKVSCEVALVKKGNPLCFVQMSGIIAVSDQECRIALVDITEHRQLEEFQAFLARTITTTADSSFFKELARHLAESLVMDFVCIDRLEGDGLSARTLAVWCDGHFGDNVTYALKDTPCGDVVGKTVCCFPAGVNQLYPHDQVLQDLRADSYVGVTLWGHTGVPIGLIAVIGRKPLLNPLLAETMLKLVAIRAAGELERLDTEVALAEKRNELEELNSSLQACIVEAVDELRMKDQLLIMQDRLAVMGEMINNIAHQWRQPLNVLGLYLQEMPFVYDTAEFSREYLETCVGKSMELIAHMSQTIDDFRNFFRSDKEIVTFGVNKVIAHTVALIEKNFQDHRISIVLQSEGEPLVSGYPNEYAQVLLNILMNARDALVGHTVKEARISVHVFSEGDTSVVTVTDNAGGIDTEIMNRLFDPYFTTKEPDKGTGIGLFMAKTIIEKNMGGKLTVRNTGNGAEFRIEV